MTVPVPVRPQGSLEDGRIIDTSLSRDPLQVELGKRQVIPGERCFWGTGGGGDKNGVWGPTHTPLAFSSQAWSRVCWTCVWGKAGGQGEGGVPGAVPSVGGAPAGFGGGFWG